MGETETHPNMETVHVALNIQPTTGLRIKHPTDELPTEQLEEQSAEQLEEQSAEQPAEKPAESTVQLAEPLITSDEEKTYAVPIISAEPDLVATQPDGTDKSAQPEEIVESEQSEAKAPQSDLPDGKSEDPKPTEEISPAIIEAINETARRAAAAKSASEINGPRAKLPTAEFKSSPIKPEKTEPKTEFRELTKEEKAEKFNDMLIDLILDGEPQEIFNQLIKLNKNELKSLISGKQPKKEAGNHADYVTVLENKLNCFDSIKSYIAYDGKLSENNFGAFLIFQEELKTTHKEEEKQPESDEDHKPDDKTKVEETQSTKPEPADIAAATPATSADIPASHSEIQRVQKVEQELNPYTQAEAAYKHFKNEIKLTTDKAKAPGLAVPIIGAVGIYYVDIMDGKKPEIKDILDNIDKSTSSLDRNTRNHCKDLALDAIKQISKIAAVTQHEQEHSSDKAEDGISTTAR